jgi:hypothetical protein
MTRCPIGPRLRSSSASIKMSIAETVATLTAQATRAAAAVGEPLPNTAGWMPLTCASCYAEAVCVQKKKHNGRGQAWCRIVPAYFPWRKRRAG